MITVPALTVSLTSGQICSTRAYDHRRGARETTVSGTGQSRVFDVTGGTASISGVTITGGDGFDTPGGTAGPGGGILVDGGTLTLADSTVTGNQTIGTNEGSGIQAAGSLTVLRSTISFNSGPGSNRAGGIGFAGSGTLQVIDSTLAHNTLESGGLGAGSLCQLGRERRVHQRHAGSRQCRRERQRAGSQRRKLFGDDREHDCGRGFVGELLADAGDEPLTGGNIDDQNLCKFTALTDHPSTDPQLGALQNNGGPTDTQLPPVASPPIDAGVDAACPATDQRGVSRPQGPHCDSGAVERSKPTAGSPTVSNITPTGASVTATANPVFLGGSYIYNYGTTTAYGQSTASAQLQAGVGAQPAPATLAGLTPGMAYHLQLVVTTPDGTAASSDVTFTTQSTQSAPPAPSKPAISSLRVSPKSFSLAGRRVNGRCVQPTRKNDGNKHCRRPSALRISYTLNVAATVTLTVERQDTGRKLNGRCVKPTTKNRKHRKCTRLVNVPGKLTLAGEAGANQSTFKGKIGGHQLGPGDLSSYRQARGRYLEHGHVQARALTRDANHTRGWRGSPSARVPVYQGDRAADHALAPMTAVVTLSPTIASAGRPRSRDARIHRRLSHKGFPSAAFNTIPVWRRTSLKAVVSRGFCCRRTSGIGCRRIIWRGL